MLQTTVKTISYEKVTRQEGILFRKNRRLLANIVVVTVRYYTNKITVIIDVPKKLFSLIHLQDFGDVSAFST